MRTSFRDRLSGFTPFTGPAIRDPVSARMRGLSTPDASTEIVYSRERGDVQELSADVVQSVFGQFVGKMPNASGHFIVNVVLIAGEWTVTAISRASETPL